MTHPLFLMGPSLTMVSLCPSARMNVSNSLAKPTPHPPKVCRHFVLVLEKKIGQFFKYIFLKLLINKY